MDGCHDFCTTTGMIDSPIAATAPAVHPCAPRWSRAEMQATHPKDHRRNRG